MSSQKPSKLLQITSPCSAEWDQMIGTDRMRFCEHCQLTVHEISEMNRKQVRRLVASSQGRLCVRYEEPAKPLLLLHHIGRRTSRIAAGAFSASLSFTSAFATGLKPGPTNFVQNRPVVTATSSFQTGGGAALSGVIFDPAGAAIPWAQVSLTNVETNQVLTASSDSSGTYKFENLPAGTFNLKIAAEGFAASDVPFIKLGANDTNRIDQTLSIAAVQAEVEVVGERIVMMGAVAMPLPKEPLVLAAQEDNLEAVRLALLQTRDSNIRDTLTSTTALEIAVRNSNREMIQLLLWAKADVNLKDSGGQTVLMMLGEDATSEIVWDLINAGAKINLRDNDGETALMAVAQVNNVEVLKTLLDAGAKVNGSNNEGMTALMFAAEAGEVNNVRALLLAGAEVNVRNKKGKSALTFAEEENHRAVARLLRSYGAIAYGQEEDKEN